jgi:formate hydrogenlyase subunit 3/multisubunit Na+/H+ antiporter MnhD subunit
MFAVLWTGWMLWSNGELAAANIAILAIVGAVAGYLWFVGMRWFFRRIGQLPNA